MTKKTQPLTTPQILTKAQQLTDTHSLPQREFQPPQTDTRTDFKGLLVEHKASVDELTVPCNIYKNHLANATPQALRCLWENRPPYLAPLCSIATTTAANPSSLFNSPPTSPPAPRTQLKASSAETPALDQQINSKHQVQELTIVEIPTQLKALAARTHHHRNANPTQSIGCKNSRPSKCERNSKHQVQEVTLIDMQTQLKALATTTANSEATDKLKALAARRDCHQYAKKIKASGVRSHHHRNAKQLKAPGARTHHHRNANALKVR
jgi:hypothetical protein